MSTGATLADMARGYGSMCSFVQLRAASCSFVQLRAASVCRQDQKVSTRIRWVHSPKGANAFLTRRTRRDLNSVAEETSSSEGTKKPSQAFSFAFFAPSRETNLLSKFAPFGECTQYVDKSI